MRKQISKQLEKFRIRHGPYSSDKRRDGRNGLFLIPCHGVKLKVMISDGSRWTEAGLPPPPWEHVSVSLETRCPTWSEMDFVKRLFWADAETVVQFHVPRSLHIDCHSFCLHMWRPVGVKIPLPPAITVGHVLPQMETR